MATIIDYLNTLLEGRPLNYQQAKQMLDLIFEGQVPEAQVAALLTALRIRPPTAQEIAGLASSLRSHVTAVEVDIPDMIDTCGTGGGQVKTCNVSTAAAIVAAGAGAYVAKHGNRGITSGCGSADVLEALGVKIDADPQVVARCIKDVHIGFMFAPKFHPAMRFVQPIRKALGFRTIFNILGPLANPAGVRRQVMGVPDQSMLRPIADALCFLGATRAMVVHSLGLDEIGISGPTTIMDICDGRVRSYQLDPKDYGFAYAQPDQIKVDGPQDSARLIRQILAAEQSGPSMDIVVLNAAAAIVVAGLAEDIREGIDLADRSIKEGKAMACLEGLMRLSRATV